MVDLLIRQGLTRHWPEAMPIFSIVAPRPPQEAWKGTKIEAKRLPRSKKDGIRTENVEISKIKTLSMKMHDFLVVVVWGCQIYKFSFKKLFGERRGRHVE